MRASRIQAVATQKVSVTLDVYAIDRVRRAVGPRGLSSYLDAALAEKLERDERRQAMLDYLNEFERVDPTSETIRRRGQERADRIRSQVET